MPTGTGRNAPIPAICWPPWIPGTSFTLMRRLVISSPRSPEPKRAVVALVILLGALAASCAGSHRDVVRPPRESPRPEPLAPTAGGLSKTGVRHTVQAGHTLWRISRVYGVPLEKLVAVNGLEDPGSLSIGQSLFIPGATAIREVPTEASTRFDWPIPDGRILSGFGVLRGGHRHKGIDIRGSLGQPVRAAGEGRIVYSGSTLRGYGKTVIIDHGDNMQSLYAHNSTLLVTVGERVARGPVVARVGRTGNATTEHCHFEVRKRDVAVDPLHYLRGAMGSAR